MSRIICTAAIRGAHKIVKQAEENLREAVESKGKDTKVEFPNNGYYLPIIYSATGLAVKTLSVSSDILHKSLVISAFIFSMSLAIRLSKCSHRLSAILHLSLYFTKKQHLQTLHHARHGTGALATGLNKKHTT